MTRCLVSVWVGPGHILQAEGDARAIDTLEWVTSHRAAKGCPHWAAPLVRWVTAWQRGESAPLPALREPDGFCGRVLKQLARVPRGSVVTYGQLAAAVGNPNAARAVAQACARNPHPLLVPCHRVVASGGGLGGYSGGRGIETKRWLLTVEGAWPPATPDPRP